MIRLASTLLMLRAGACGLEVLMVQRTGRARFAGGFWVFPGGVVDDVDSSDLATSLLAGYEGEDANWVSAAFRETAEEINAYITTRTVPDDVRADLDGLTGTAMLQRMVESDVCFDASGVAYISNWITPRFQPKRYDTRFYVTEVPADIPVAVDEEEIVDLAWVRPADVLDRSSGMSIIFPTIRHLQLLSGFDAPDEVVAHARSITPSQIEPRAAFGDDGKLKKLFVPGDPGYDDIDPDAAPLMTGFP